MKNKLIIILGFFLIIFSSAGIFSYLTSQVQYTQYGTPSTISPITPNLNQEICQQGNDLLIQIDPLGCSPTIVRSDLLEQNDVPVLCQLTATKLNPLIDIQAIDTISFSGKYPPEVSGIGFHPAQAALGTQGGELNSPILNNIGYVVVVLKKQPNESAMPNYVPVNLTANLKYNIQKAFGIGDAMFYLPQFTDEKSWESSMNQYSFWDGRGALRADNIQDNSADISLYSGAQKISEVSLTKGQTSDSIYIPGFSCQAGLKLQLTDLTNPDTRVRLLINSDVVDVAKGDKFLDNKCQVQDMNKYGLLQRVTLTCNEDSGVSNFNLAISPRVILTVSGISKEYGLGDWLYDETGNYGTRSVYLGYIGTNGNSNDQNDLYVYLVSSPIKKNVLNDNEIGSISSLVGGLIEAKATSTGVISSLSTGLKVSAGYTNGFSRFISSGESMYRLNFADKEKTFSGFDKPVSIISFAGPQDVVLSDTVKIPYENATTNYETLKNQFISETFGTNSTFGEEAAYNEIVLAWDASQKKTVIDLCNNFKQNYPNSNKVLDNYCNNNYQSSNSNTSNVYVTVDQQTKQISFEGIYEPSFDDFGATIMVVTPNGTQYFDLTKDKINYLDNQSADYVQLVSLSNDTAQVRTGIGALGVMNQINKQFGSDVIPLKLNYPVSFSGGYSFTLSKVNLKKLAQVYVIPNINNAGSQANFSFQIGIEKRTFDLPPDQIKQMILNLDNDISKWGNISNTLGNVTQVMKAACLVAGAALTAQNFITNAGGDGIARQYVMQGSGGWYAKCTNLVSKKTYVSQDQCLSDNSDEIDSEVTTLSAAINNQNSQVQQLEQGVTTQQFLTDKVVNTDAFMQKYAPQVSNNLNNILGDSITDPSGNGQPIKKQDILTDLSYQGYKNRVYTVDQLKEIDLFSTILVSTSASINLKQIAGQRLYSDLLNVKTNSGNFAQLSNLANNLGVNPSQIGFLEVGSNVKVIPYTGLTNGDLKDKKLTNFPDTTPVYLAPANDGRTYLIVLDNSFGTPTLPIYLDKTTNKLAIYDYNSLTLIQNPPTDLTRIYFQKMDSSSYKNQYKNAKLTYYETAPYKGMPAIVPFDLTNGWYAAIKQTLPGAGNIQSYDASARVNSFYLCNVGANGIQEFQQPNGDDTCEMINTGTGQPYNQFPGLSQQDATTEINQAVQAIEQAQKLYKPGLSGKVKILNSLVDVGAPAVSTPQAQCQDTMSPKDCLFLFNLCDPVICPSSRCDLGGTYPVTDVVQSGIIGSILLCLPNAQEGIVIPVCLTGIKAGIDSFLSIEGAYRDCLNESLTTGSTVGICNEIYSIYICDFFWRQALPLADIIIPKLFETASGQNVRGGGEYLDVASAWTGAQDAINYLVNNYGSNSKASFLARSAENTSGSGNNSICDLYTSAVYPSNLVDTLTKPDSPPQFTGRFDEIPFSTATNPPTSQYNVYYHIYAGQDSGAYYQVYLKGSLQSSYYHDVAQSVVVDSGYIPVSKYVDQTKDFVATSGYKQLCINVNGQEDCGFQQVSTSFASNYVQDQYFLSQANQTNIQTTSDCVSGSASAYSLLNPNAQSAASQLANPSIYNEGLIRVCATSDPGQGTDPYAGTQNARWKIVGYCDTPDMKCWIDTQSISNVVNNTALENETLNQISQNYLDVLTNDSSYLSTDQFSSAVQQIQDETDNTNKLNMINNIIGRAFWSSQKAELLYLRGNAYAEIFRALWAQQPKPSATISTTTGTTTTQGLGDANQKVLAEASSLDGAPADPSIIAKGLGISESDVNCWESIMYVYKLAGVNVGPCQYSDPTGRTYSITYQGSTSQIIMGVSKRADQTSPSFLVYPTACSVNSPPQNDQVKYDDLQSGDIMSIVSDPRSGGWGHNVIFIGWTDKTNRIARIFGWRNVNGKTVYQSYDQDISPTGDVFYVSWHPSLSTTPQETNNEIKKQDTSQQCIIENSNNQGSTSCSGSSCTLPSASNVCTNAGGICQDSASSCTNGQMGTGMDTYAQACVNALNGNSNAACCNPSTTTTSASSSVGGQIYNKASSLVGSSESDIQLVSDSLTNSGITGVSGVSSINELSLLLNKQLVEVNVNDLKQGDIVLIGKGCNAFYTVGVFSDISGINYNFYTNLNGQIAKDYTTSLSQISDYSNNDLIYIYRAYRAGADLTDTEKANLNLRTKWTVDSALTQVNNILGSSVKTNGGTYSDNKDFSNQLVFDGILTEQNCNVLRGKSGGFLFFGAPEKDMAWLKDLLTQEKISSG